MSKRIRLVRKPETEARYREYLSNEQKGICPFCLVPGSKRVILKKYKHWYITKNDYSYDVDYSVSDMLVPFAHIESIYDLNSEQLSEFMEIRKDILTMGYDELLENLPGVKTQVHFHQHLLSY